jgi:hypothetical protein
MPNLDHRFARRLRILRRVVSKVTVVDLHQRTFVAGPALLERFTLGVLAAEGVRAIVENNHLSRELVGEELKRRGLSESVNALMADAQSLETVSDMSSEQKLEQVAAQIEGKGITNSTLGHIGRVIDSIEPETGYMINPTMMSSQEHLDDLYATNADDRAIDAYVAGVEITSESPSTNLLAVDTDNKAADAETLEQEADSTQHLTL